MKKNKFYPLGGTTVFLVDQWAKHYVEKNLKMGEKRKLAEKLELRRVHNPGICLGVFANKPEKVKKLTEAGTGIVTVTQMLTLLGNNHVLKKAGKLDIKTIYPLHGPILSDEIPEVLRLYTIWSSYEPEDEGVFIAYASMHGNTAEAARKMKEILEEKGAKVVISDLSRSDMAENVENAFRYSTLLCMAPSYDGTVFTPMADFIHRLKTKLYQNRRVALVENASWAPSAVKAMKSEFETMKNIDLIDNTVTIKTTLKENDIDALKSLADEILK